MYQQTPDREERIREVKQWLGLGEAGHAGAVAIVDRDDYRDRAMRLSEGSVDRQQQASAGKRVNLKEVERLREAGCTWNAISLALDCSMDEVRMLRESGHTWPSIGRALNLPMVAPPTPAEDTAYFEQAVRIFESLGLPHAGAVAAARGRQ